MPEIDNNNPTIDDSNDPITIKAKILVRRDTTAAWNAFTGFVPMKGEIIVYTDRYQKDGVNVPGIKIGDGNAYLVDLPFADPQDSESILSELRQHTNNDDIHVSSEDRTKWDNNNHFEATVESEKLIMSST